MQCPYLFAFAMTFKGLVNVTLKFISELYYLQLHIFTTDILIFLLCILPTFITYSLNVICQIQIDTYEINNALTTKFANNISDFNYFQEIKNIKNGIGEAHTCPSKFE